MFGARRLALGQVETDAQGAVRSHELLRCEFAQLLDGRNWTGTRFRGASDILEDSARPLDWLTAGSRQLAASDRPSKANVDPRLSIAD